MIHVLSYMQLSELSPISHLGEEYKKLCNSELLWNRREMVCYHSKATFEEDVLGIGINMEYTRESKLLKSVTTPMDLLSLSAYQEGVRKGVWNEPFTYWLPIYINKEHGTKSMKLFENYVELIYSDIIMEESTTILVKIVDLLCKLMSSMVVEIMKGETHASLKALEYYCHFHRLLLYHVQEHPELGKMIDDRVRRFMTSESARSKTATPNIGEFLPLVSVSKYAWKDVVRAVVLETLDRNSFWIKMKHPTLANLKIKDQGREVQSWQCSKVGLQLLMFHSYFLQNVVDKSANQTLQDLAHQYDIRYGRPTREMQDKMQLAVFDIQKCSGYMQFFKYVKFKVRDIEEVKQMLRDAMSNMLRKGYNNQKREAFVPKINDDTGYLGNRNGMFAPASSRLARKFQTVVPLQAPQKQTIKVEQKKPTSKVTRGNYFDYLNDENE